jgi:hypothetical protein
MLDLVFARVKRGQCGKTTHGCMPMVQIKEGGKGGKVCTFHECVLEDNHKTCAHGDVIRETAAGEVADAKIKDEVICRG